MSDENAACAGPVRDIPGRRPREHSTRARCALFRPIWLPAVAGRLCLLATAGNSTARCKGAESPSSQGSLAQQTRPSPQQLSHQASHTAMAQPAGDPLAGNTRYRKIKDINKGSFGFVVLAENLETREQVAIKFTRVE